MNKQIKKTILHRINKLKYAISRMDKRYVGNEKNFTYHGGFGHGYAKGKLAALEDIADILRIEIDE